MKLDLEQIAKEVFKDKDLFIEELPENKVKIWYKNERIFRSIGASDPAPFVLMKSIELDEKFAEAVGMYLGDGKTTKNDTAHIDFVSKDCDMLVFMLNFFMNKFLVSLSKLTISIKYKAENKNDVLDKWSILLNIQKSKFKISYSSRNRYDTVSIQVNSTILRKLFDEIIEISLPFIKLNEKLRKGFLRGYFAAEGTIGYSKNENYLNYVGFSYNPKTEKWLRNYCIVCLAKENIDSVFKERKNNRAEIIISSWNNYWKFWSIDMFDRCIRKKDKFSRILLSRDIYCQFNDKFRCNLFVSLGMTQKEIAKIIKSYQGNVCMTIKGEHLLSIRQIKDLIPYTNLSIKDFIQNIEAIRVGNGKNDIQDRKFIENIIRMSS